MQITVALDVSEKPGFAIIHDQCLVRSGTLFQQNSKSELGPYPYNYIQLAIEVADRILVEVLAPETHNMGVAFDKMSVCIEETTASSQNYSQKILEFIHYETLNVIRGLRDEMVNVQVHYIRDGVWKRMTGANQSKVERNWNARVARNKKKRGKTIAMLVTEKGGKDHP